MTPFEKWIKNEVGLNPKEVMENPLLKTTYEAIWDRIQKLEEEE